MTKNPLSFLLAGFRYLLHGFSAGRLFDRCRFGRLSRRIFWETAAADAVVLLLTFFVPLEIAYRLQLEPRESFSAGVALYVAYFVCRALGLPFQGGKTTAA